MAMTRSEARQFYSAKREGDRIVLRATHPQAKQALWGWAGDGSQDDMLRYGREATPGQNWRGDYTLWEWKLTVSSARDLAFRLRYQDSDAAKRTTYGRAARELRDKLDVLVAKAKGLPLPRGTKYGDLEGCGCGPSRRRR